MRRLRAHGAVEVDIQWAAGKETRILLRPQFEGASASVRNMECAANGGALAVGKAILRELAQFFQFVSKPKRRRCRRTPNRLRALVAASLVNFRNS